MGTIEGRRGGFGLCFRMRTSKLLLIIVGMGVGGTLLVVIFA